MFDADLELICQETLRSNGRESYVLLKGEIIN